MTNVSEACAEQDLAVAAVVVMVLDEMRPNIV
jgi:hypothetical protein